MGFETCLVVCLRVQFWDQFSVCNFLTNGMVSMYGAFADNYRIFLQYHQCDSLEGMNGLQGELNQLSLVASSWNLSLDKKKCVVMRFSRHFASWGTIGDCFQYKMGNTPFNFVECHRDLGVLIDRQLKFHSHIGGVVHRLSSRLLRSAVSRSPEFMVALFTTHVRPILD